MSVQLYKIEQQYLEIEEALIESEGVVTPEIEEQLEFTNELLEEKAKNYAYVILNAKADEDTIKAEIARLTKLLKPKQKLQTFLNERISKAMVLFGKKRIETPTLTLSLRRSESVLITDENVLPEDYITVKTTTAPDKKAIKLSIDAGEEVDGAELKENFNLQIK